MREPLFECQHLVKRYGDVAVVDDLSFHLQAGECLGVIGPNGAGKTTFATNLQIAYFDQMREAIDPDATLEDFISPGSEWITIG